jgi:hypothetical protein
VRTWPSTIFWRAVEKPDIGGPCGSEGGRAAEPRHLWYKPQENATRHRAPTRTGRWPCTFPLDGAPAGPRRAGAVLFDGHRKPPDQPCDLVQMAGIMRFDGALQPRQAFVVAEGWNIAGNNRGHWLPRAGPPGIWHRINSTISPLQASLRPNETIWRQRVLSGCRSWRHGASCRNRPFRLARMSGKSLPKLEFPRCPGAAPAPVISSYASRSGFVIRSALANMCVACSSVAQR